MKKIGEYTCRGKLTHQVTEKIILFDGKFDTAYRVTEFIIAAQNIESGRDASGIIFTESSGADLWKWEDNTQIAWSASIMINDGGYSPFTLVDPDNLVVEDLYVRGSENNGGDLNYFIRMDKYEITDWRGALAMVRNSSQDV